MLALRLLHRQQLHWRQQLRGLCSGGGPGHATHQRRLQLTRLGFSRAQAVSLAGRLPGDPAELSEALDRLSEAASILRQLGVREPHETLTRLGPPECFELDGPGLHERLELLRQFLTRAACARLVESRPKLLARDTGELGAIADYLVTRCGYSPDVLALMPDVWQLGYAQVVARREVFAKTGRLTRQPKRQFNARSVAGCDCFSGSLPDFLRRAGISGAEYDAYFGLTENRLAGHAGRLYYRHHSGEADDDERAESEAEAGASSGDEGSDSDREGEEDDDEDNYNH